MSARPPSELADPTALLEVEVANPRSLDRLGSEFDAVDDEEVVVDGPLGAPLAVDDPVDDPLDLDDSDAPVIEDGGPMTLDGVLEEPAFDRTYERRPSSVTGVEMQQLEDPLEADFSDIAAGDRRSRRTMPPPLDDDDDDLPSIRMPRPGAARPSSDNDVYTSASRPNPLIRRGRSYDDDDIAPPPPPPAAPEPRRGPAIVRRTMAHAIARDDTQITPPHGHDISLFERTRIADTSEIEERANASRNVATLVPVDDDAYDDIEIGDEPRAAAPEIGTATPAVIAAAPGSAPVPVVDAYSAGRRTAHVLRRAETPTRPPPAVQPPAVIELDADDEPPPRRNPGAEDDFSDVAAAVGADGDLEDAAGLDPDLDPPPTRIELDLDDVGEPPPDSSEEAFTGGYDDDDEPPPDVSEMLDAPTVLVPALADDVPEPPPPPPRSGPTALPRPVVAASPRPPAPSDLYPSRVKTPTSVPPLGKLSATLTSLPPIPPQLVTEGDRSMLARSEARTSDPGPRESRGVTAELASRPPLRVPVSTDSSPELEYEPTLDLDAAGRDWPEQVAPLPTAALDEACAAVAADLRARDRRRSTTAWPRPRCGSRRAGCASGSSDLERARAHYDAALLADPRATAALRGLRRIARASGDLVEATRHLDAEIAVAGALERRPLGHYRVDLLMASGEQDLARVAVGELLDTAPSDVRALLAQLELAFLDGRADEFGSALEQLAHAVTDNELRARGAVGARRARRAPERHRRRRAAGSPPPPSPIRARSRARLGAIRDAAAQADGEAAGHALVDLARQVEATDPITAAAAAVRAQQWTRRRDSRAAAALLAIAAAPSDPLVARLAAEAAAPGAERRGRRGRAFAHWATAAAAPAERAYAAARAAELDPARGAELWAQALALDPGDDYAAAQLRTAHVARERRRRVDRRRPRGRRRPRARARAAARRVRPDRAGPARRRDRRARAGQRGRGPARSRSPRRSARRSPRPATGPSARSCSPSSPPSRASSSIARSRSCAARSRGRRRSAPRRGEADARRASAEDSSARPPPRSTRGSACSSTARSAPTAHAAAIVLATPAR